MNSNGGFNEFTLSQESLAHHCSSSRRSLRCFSVGLGTCPPPPDKSSPASVVEPVTESATNSSFAKNIQFTTPPFFLSSYDRQKRPIHVPIKNDTNADIEFLTPVYSCGCTDGKFEKSHLSPGESTQLQLEVDVTRLAGSKTITVRMPRAEGKPWLLSIEIPAFPKAGFQSAETFLGELQAGTREVRECYLDFHASDKGSLGMLTGLESDSDRLSASLLSEEVDSPRSGVFRRRAKIELVTEPNHETGQFRGTITANPGSNFEASHAVLWRVRSLYELTPERLVVNGGNRDAVERTVRVRRRDHRRFQISPVDSLPEGVALSHDSTSTESDHVLSFSVKTALLPTPRLLKLEFRTSADDDALVSIPLVVLPGVSRERAKENSRSTLEN